MRTNTWQLIGLALATSLAMIGCGSDDSDTASSEPSTTDDQVGDTSTGAEMRSVTFGIQPIGISSREVIAADDFGYFEESGLAIELSETMNTSLLTQQLANGEVDMGYSTYQSAVQALTAGVDIVFVAGIQNLEEDIQEVWVAKDSQYETFADLAGERVGLAAVGGYGDILYGEALEQAGLSLDDVTLTEIPFSDMSAAIESGDIAAGWLPAPFAAAQRSNPESPLRELLDFNDVETLSDLPQGAVISSTGFVETDSDLVEDFRGAVERAADQLAENPEEDRDLQIQLAGFEPSVADELPLQAYVGDDVGLEDLERVTALMTKYEQLEGDVDLEKFLGAEG